MMESFGRRLIVESEKMGAWGFACRVEEYMMDELEDLEDKNLLLLLSGEIEWEKK